MKHLALQIKIFTALVCLGAITLNTGLVLQSTLLTRIGLLLGSIIVLWVLVVTLRALWFWIRLSRRSAEKRETR